MIPINSLLEDQLKKQALLRNMAPEQLVQEIMAAHSKASGIERILLEEKEPFIEFVRDYKTVVDDIFIVIDDVYRKIDEQTTDDTMKSVFEELFFFISRDLGLFVYLYEIYKDEINE